MEEDSHHVLDFPGKNGRGGECGPARQRGSMIDACIAVPSSSYHGRNLLLHCIGGGGCCFSQNGKAFGAVGVVKVVHGCPLLLRQKHAGKCRRKRRRFRVAPPKASDPRDCHQCQNLRIDVHPGTRQALVQHDRVGGVTSSGGAAQDAEDEVVGRGQGRRRLVFAGDKGGGGRVGRKGEKKEEKWDGDAKGDFQPLIAALVIPPLSPPSLPFLPPCCIKAQRSVVSSPLNKASSLIFLSIFPYLCLLLPLQNGLRGSWRTVCARHTPEFGAQFGDVHRIVDAVDVVVGFVRRSGQKVDGNVDEKFVWQVNLRKTVRFLSLKL